MIACRQGGEETPPSGATRWRGKFMFRCGPIAVQRPTTRFDRPTHSNLAWALHSSCDDHHEKALSSLMSGTSSARCCSNRTMSGRLSAKMGTLLCS
jgi:hypothetical protein